MEKKLISEIHRTLKLMNIVESSTLLNEANMGPELEIIFSKLVPKELDAILAKLKLIYPKDMILNSAEQRLNKIAKFQTDTLTIALSSINVLNKNQLAIRFNNKIAPQTFNAIQFYIADSNQHLFIAEWGGSCISKWDSKNGKLLDRYKLPVSNITSCAIDIHNNIYITTAKSENIDEHFGGALLYLKFIK
jgi:hypothetical protein